MAANSHIEWTDHTFNPWIGCTKVSPGCAHCYAETLMDTRYGKVKWGTGNPRVRTSAANWKLPVKWNRTAALRTPLLAMGYERPRVFCASLADWLDDEVPIEWLADLLALIHATPHLDWLLLSKRPQNFAGRINLVSGCYDLTTDVGKMALGKTAEWYIAGKPPENVWIGTTVEDQPRADERIPALLKIPAKVRFLSCEPLLGPVNLSRSNSRMLWPEGIHWVIAGGESGPGARPMHPDWPRGLRDQCQAAGVPFLFKQNGEYVSVSEVAGAGEHFTFPDGATVRRTGKKVAGRTLDGREWTEFPKTHDLKTSTN